MAKKAPKRKSAPETSAALPPTPAIDLSFIVEGLRPLAVPAEQLVLDPRNARDHDERSVSAIAASLREFGIRKPLVVRRGTNVVIAGNGSLQAARLNGWTHLPVVFVDDDDKTATSFAIADNRTAELSTWDQDQLAELLREVDAVDDELRRMFDDLAADLPGLLESAVAATSDAVAEAGGTSGGKGRPSTPTPAAAAAKFQIMITCTDEAHQTELLQRFQAEEIECRALVS